METLIVNIDTASNAHLLAEHLKTVKTVKSVQLFIPSFKKQKGEEYDWTNPIRPATDAEFELMISECERDENVPIETVRKNGTKKIKQWMNANQTSPLKGVRRAV